MTSPSRLSNAVSEQNQRLADFSVSDSIPEMRVAVERYLAATKSHPSLQLTLFTIVEHSVTVEKDAQKLH